MLLHRVVTLMATLALPALAHAAPTPYPLTLQNCASPLTFEHAPKSAVTIGQAGTEMFYALGLGDRLVGTSLWFNDVPVQYQAQNDKVERLADNDPSFEAVIAKRPELVAVQLEWMVGPQGVVGTREQFHELNIPTYLMPSDCEGKDNLVGADGKSISQLAEIFDVQQRGEQLNSQLKASLEKSITSLKGKDLSSTSALFWFSSADMDIDPYVAGRKGIPDFMLNTLGVRNVVESDEEWPTVGWETLAKANPTFLVIARRDRRRFPADDYQKKLEFLRTDPVTRTMDAVKNNRIIVLDAHAMQASLRLFDGIETLATAIRQHDLPK